MGEANGVHHGGDAARDRAALRRAAGWAFVHERPPEPTADELRRFESDFLRPVREWCEAHADKVAACYVDTPRRKVEVFVVRRRTGYDPDLENDMIALNSALHRAGWRWVMVDSVFSDDPDEQSGTFNPDEALVVYCVRRSTPAQGRVEPPLPVHD